MVANANKEKVLKARSEHEAILRQSVKITRASVALVRKWQFLSPFDVMQVLNGERIRFVLIGSFGLCGWRNQARAAGYSELVVSRSACKRVVERLSNAFPKLEACEFRGSIDLCYPRNGNVAVKIAMPDGGPLSELLRHTEKIDSGGVSFRIPNLEMALALTFADMASEDREWAERYQAAHDFICIVEANELIDEKRLTRLASLVSAKSGKEIIVRINRIRRGEKLGDLTLGS